MSRSLTSQKECFYSQISHHHGGQLRAVSEKYGIPLENWLDLSTGINPNSYPLPDAPSRVWQRLPEINDDLAQAASEYYGSKNLLPVAGSQAAIQSLPALLIKNKVKPCRVGILKPAYQSHQNAWEKQGAEIISLSREQITPARLALLDVLIVVNPTNPTAEFYHPDLLLEWHQDLVQHGGTLIIDEAFMDVTPAHSMIRTNTKKGLIVLRSIGKFFGLAGIRLGFVWAQSEILQLIDNQQDDWAVSHPARWAGTHALQNKDWQQAQQNTLPKQAERLVELLEEIIFNKPLLNGGVYFNTTNQHVQATAFFAYFEHPRAEIIYQQLAERGVLVRFFPQPPALRFGLPANEKEWLNLAEQLHFI